jgi:hypothetical protein
MPKAAEPWSLTSLREKLIKIGAKVVSHGRYVTFQLAEVAVSRQMFADPDAHRPAAGATRAGVTGRWGQIRQTATGKVRLDERKATGCSLASRATRRAANERRCARISLRAAPMKWNITPNQPGIRGMSAYTSFGCDSIIDRDRGKRRL